MMRTLIWKEFWQNSRVLLAVAIVAIAPYLVLPSIAISEMIADAIKSDDRHVAPQWSDIIQSAALCSMVLSTVLAAFVGGNVFAGERADRSAEFAAGLPIPRRGVLAAKAIVSMGFCLGLWL
ncbi:MAG TPA: ABC transporter permease subunit, partial [Phycisphaerae bacterium]|nr:ABC transporter permease subunit [Phycisphaerae bacterium]